MISKVDEDIELYVKRYDIFKKENGVVLETVDGLLKPPQRTTNAVTSNAEGAASTEFGRFSAVPDLKPVFLDTQ